MESKYEHVAVAFRAAAVQPKSQVHVVRSQISPIEMNTKYTVAAGLAKKKNPNSGTAASLKGYKVGMRAPNSAVRSGTTQAEQKAWDFNFLGLGKKSK